MGELKERIDDIVTPFNSGEKLEIPKNMLIEVTNACNANCIFCANRKSTRTKQNIDDKFVYRIASEAHDLGVQEVGFYTTGEPLLSKNLSNYIKHARDKGFRYIYITTNGILGTLDKLIPLIECGLNSIKFSINAINKDDYEFIHGIDRYDIVMNNLKQLYEYKKKNELNLKIFVSYIATKYTEYDNETIYKLFKEICDDIVIINVRNQSGMMPENNELLLCEHNKNKIKGERNLPCHYPFKTICITKEGYLTACCTDFNNYLAIADLNKVDLKTAWNCKEYLEFREKQLNGNIKNTLCYNCIYSGKEMPDPLNSELFTPMSTSVYIDNQEVLNRIRHRKK